MKKVKRDNTVKLAKFERKFKTVGAVMLFSLWVISFFGKLSLS